MPAYNRQTGHEAILKENAGGSRPADIDASLDENRSEWKR
jgi:hypothetical protein